MAETITLPDGNKAPAWATEETMKELLKTFKESRLFKKDAARPGASDDDNPLDKPGKAMADAIFKLTGNKQLGALSNQVMNSAEAFGTKGLAGGLGLFGKGIGLAAESAGVFAPALQKASVMLTAYAALLGNYLNMLGAAIDVGLGFSSSLGDSATVAGRAGVSLTDFYKAVKATEGTYRALGDNAMEAAKNFGVLQSSVRGTYGTFGMSNDAMATATADYVKLVAQSGLRGQAATDAAGEAYGKSMEQMRKISIATGVSFSSLQKNMKDLISSPIIIAGINKFGTTTEQATERLAKGAAGFEAVFGKLGGDLYKQMAEAEAAGLSIINTKLGAELAPFTDLGALTKFNKMMQDGSGTAAEMAEAQRSFLSATEANLPTLRLLAQQGDAASKQMLELYNSTKQTTIMSQTELDGLAAKKRAEEGMLTVQNKISAAYNNLTAKLYGLLNVIPVEAFEALGAVMSSVIDVGGAVIDVISELAPALGLTAALVGAYNAVLFISTGGLQIMAGGLLAAGSAAWAAAAPFLPLIAILGVITGAGYLIIKNWDLIAEAATNLWTSFTGIIDAIGNWFSNSWIGKMLGGNSNSEGVTSNPMGDASSAIMDSVSRNDAGPVKSAAIARSVDSAEADRRVADRTNTQLETIASLTSQSLNHQSTTAKNTANTADAVTNSSTNY